MKRRRIGTPPPAPPSQYIPSPDSPNAEPVPTCARTDAIRVNRDIQMKYDIVKNDEGPLGKTMHGTFKDPIEVFRSAPGQGMGGAIGSSKEKDVPTIDRHPGLTERFKNIEDHLAVRYSGFHKPCYCFNSALKSYRRSSATTGRYSPSS